MKTSKIYVLEAARGVPGHLRDIPLNCLRRTGLDCFEVTECSTYECPLYQFRMAQNPFGINTEKKNNEQ